MLLLSSLSLHSSAYTSAYADVCRTHVSVDVSMPFASHVRHEEDCKKRGEGRETEREESLRGERQKGGDASKERARREERSVRREESATQPHAY